MLKTIVCILIWTAATSPPAVTQPNTAPPATVRVAASQPTAPKVLAVLPAEHRGPTRELAAAEDGLGDMLAVLLADNPAVHVVERVHVRKLLREKELTLAGIVEPAQAAKVGSLLNAGFIVAPAIETSGANVEIRCHLIEVAGARIVHSVHEKGELKDLLAVTQRCAHKLAVGLNINITDLHPEELDRSPRISLLFMRGLSFYHDGLPERAQVEFMKIILLDPMHEEARAFSARAFHEAGEREHARIAAEWFLENFPQSRYREQIKAIRTEAVTPEPETAQEPADVNGV